MAVRSKYWNQLSRDEPVVLYYDPLSKRKSKEWCKPGEALPRKAKVTQSAKKIMATIVWDCRGLLLIDFEERNTRPRDSCREVFKSMEIMTLYSQYIYSLVLYTVNNKHLFDANNEIHKYKTRNNSNLHCPIANLSKFNKGAYTG